MTQIANITVKNGATTPVDKTFTAYQPQAGTVPALWFEKSAGDARVKWTPLTTLVRRSNDSKANRFSLTLSIPYFDTLGVELGKIPCNVTVVVPDTAPLASINDAAAYLGNLLSSSLIKDQIQTMSAAI